MWHAHDFMWKLYFTLFHILVGFFILVFFCVRVCGLMLSWILLRFACFLKILLPRFQGAPVSSSFVSNGN